MTKVNWDEYKEFKRVSHREDNFEILLDFMKSYYNMHSPNEIFESLHSDDLASMMLEKRGIVDAVILENYLFKLKK